MSWIDDIFSLVWDIATYFENIAWDARDIPFVGAVLSAFFYLIYLAFWSLLTPIAHFHDWVYNANQLLANLPSIDNIWTTFKEYFDWATWSWQWILDARWYVTGWIDEWWAATMGDVQGWIAIATQGFNDLVVAWGNFWTITWPEWTGKLDGLRAEWDNFWTVTYPELVSFDWLGTWFAGKLLEIQRLIDSSIQSWFPFYDSLAQLWNNVAEFIVSPLDWLEERLADWFLGPEV